MFRILALRRQTLILDIAAEACPDKRRKMGEENVLDEIVEMLGATFHQSSKTLFSGQRRLALSPAAHAQHPATKAPSSES